MASVDVLIACLGQELPEELECLACGDLYELPFGLDQTHLCNTCAQELCEGMSCDFRKSAY